MKILVIADIHGNATALNAVLDDAKEYDSVIFLGDAVSPGPQPNETIELLSDLQGVFLRGNHEVSMLDAGSTVLWADGFKQFMTWSREVLDADGYKLLADFKEGGVFYIDGHSLVLAHGDENPETRHILPQMDSESFRPLAYGSTVETVLFGHSHVQFRTRFNGHEFINPGSVGQNRCGHVTACYGFLIDGEFSHHHFDYDPTPWLEALERVKPLDNHPEFKEWFKTGFLTGFANGERDPWITLAAQGYR